MKPAFFRWQMLQQFFLGDVSFNHKHAEGLAQVLYVISNNFIPQNFQTKPIFNEFKDSKIRPSVKKWYFGCIFVNICLKPLKQMLTSAVANSYLCICCIVYIGTLNFINNYNSKTFWHHTVTHCQTCIYSQCFCIS